MRKSLRIIFMGTPDFAVPSLKILAEHGYNIVAVVTSPDRPAGRGLQMQASPVKKAAMELEIPVLQPEKLKDTEFLNLLSSYRADLQVVVAFRMLPELVWNMPASGTINLHASLLPDYRGAAPINWAVMNGEQETGLTTFFLQHEIDTGDIIMQQKIGIGHDENAGSLHDRMMVAGAELVLKTVDAISEGNVHPKAQVISGIPKPAPKIFRDDCRIDWQNKGLDQIFNFVRGLSPYPAAWTTLDGKVLKIYKALKESDTTGKYKFGTLQTDGKTYFKVFCKGGYLNILDVQIEGRRKMTIREFLRGYPVNSNGLV